LLFPEQLRALFFSFKLRGRDFQLYLPTSNEFVQNTHALIARNMDVKNGFLLGKKAISNDDGLTRIRANLLLAARLVDIVYAAEYAGNQGLWNRGRHCGPLNRASNSEKKR
jgi:hypothetical protein